MAQMNDIERWKSGATGRSNTVAFAETVWTVSNARNLGAGFKEQARETLGMLDSFLAQAGTGRTNLLSVQVILADMATREAFDELWCQWIGPDPGHWPQRAVFSANLAPGLLIELIAVAARTSGNTDRAA